MLTRFIRIQLTIFTIASIVGIILMVLVYMQVPTLLGIGRITVSLELPATGGLYRFSNVTYRGVEVGKVTGVQLSRGHVVATLSLATSPKIPSNLEARVRSVSAVGEQYVDLLPRTRSGPYLQNGSVIAMRDARIPPPVGPMLDKVDALISSIPQEKISALLDESFNAFNGSSYDFSSLFDSSSTITGDLNNVGDRTATLFEDTRPLLDSQADTTDSIRQWARSLAGVTDQLVINDPQVRTLVENGPGAADEATQLLEQIKPTLPVLLANLTTIGQIGVVYHASLEELLVLLPPLTAYFESSKPSNNATGLPLGDFRVQADDPPGCTVGFLPPSSWRSPAATDTIDTPDGLYCKLPQDSPIAVRGLRNAPCQNNPGKRAPTVQECYSDQPFTPVAMRQHFLGPYPLDPNLIQQGVPPDDRTTFGDQIIYAPTQGTPLPPGLGTPPGPAPAAETPAPPGPTGTAPPAAPAGEIPAAPSAFTTNGSGANPGVTATQYDPQTGYFAAPDGQTYRQTDLAGNAPQSWQDLIFRGGS
jgi:phospholipid/cholesterol/gamma-HCH transport system substrate-binding protein